MKNYRISFAFETTGLASRFHVLGTHDDFRIFGKKVVIETDRLDDLGRVLGASETMWNIQPRFVTIHILQKPQING